MPPTYKLTYFPLKGLAEPCRFIFALAGVEYEDVRIERDVWPEHKANYPWGSLPVLEVDGKMLAQSNAILRYLGKTYNLAGDNDLEAAKCDEMVEAMTDLKMAVIKYFTETDEAKKAEIKTSLESETFPKFLTVWSKTVEVNNGFLVGKRLSYADLCIASYLEVYSDMFPDMDFLAKFPTLKSHQERVFNTPGIKEWIAKRPKSQW
jgi:glutathione S-transferase